MPRHDPTTRGDIEAMKAAHRGLRIASGALDLKGMVIVAITPTIMLVGIIIAAWYSG